MWLLTAIICGLCYTVPRIWRKLHCWSRCNLAEHRRLRDERRAKRIRKEYSAVMASMSQAEAARLLKSEEVSKVIFFENNNLIVKNALNFSQKLLIFLNLLRSRELETR